MKAQTGRIGADATGFQFIVKKSVLIQDGTENGEFSLSIRAKHCG